MTHIDVYTSMPIDVYQFCVVLKIANISKIEKLTFYSGNFLFRKFEFSNKIKIVCSKSANWLKLSWTKYFQQQKKIRLLDY